MDDIIFRDRKSAGQHMAHHLQVFAHRPDVIILALPRGGVPVAIEIAKHLQVRLDISIVGKLRVPLQEELAFGAITMSGIQVINHKIANHFDLNEDRQDGLIALELKELWRRDRVYRWKRPVPDLTDLTVLLVDDGIATGATMLAAISTARLRRPAQIIVVSPTIMPETYKTLQQHADQIVCATMPEHFAGVEQCYEDFEELTDYQVIDLLEEAWAA